MTFYEIGNSESDSLHNLVEYLIDSIASTASCETGFSKVLASHFRQELRPELLHACVAQSLREDYLYNLIV